MPYETMKNANEDKSFHDIKLELHRKFNALLDEVDMLEALNAPDTRPVLSPRLVGEAVSEALEKYNEGHKEAIREKFPSLEDFELETGGFDEGLTKGTGTIAGFSEDCKVYVSSEDGKWKATFKLPDEAKVTQGTLKDGETVTFNLTTADQLDDHDHPEPQTFYAAPTSNDPGLLKALAAKFQKGLKPGQTVFKTADGKRHMLIVTSNAYKDREGETLTTDALKEDVNRHWTGDDAEFMSNNPLLFWHDDRLKIGDIVWGDVRGPMYVELAREGDGPLARKLWDALETSDEDWGASHRFAYYTQHRNQGGDYRRIYKQETSILPRNAAANLLTFSGVLPMSKRDDYLNKMVGLDNAAELLDEGIEKLVEALSAQGIDHKAKDGQPDTAKMLGVVQGFVDMADDLASLDERVEKAVSELAEQRKSFEDKEAKMDETAQKFEDAIKSVSDLADKLQERLDARPTRASRAKATEIDDGELPADVADSLVVEDAFWGKVKPAPRS